MNFISKLLPFILSFMLMLSGTVVVTYAFDDREIVDVTTFGADPSGYNDSTVAVQQALDYIKENQEQTSTYKSTLYFPKGEYHFRWDYAREEKGVYISNTNGIGVSSAGISRTNNPSDAGFNTPMENKRFGLLVKDINNLIIDGSDSLFINHGPIGMIAMINSTDVTVKNFSFDHQSPNIIEATVVEISGNTATFLFPMLLEQQFQIMVIPFYLKAATVHPKTISLILKGAIHFNICKNTTR